MLNYIYLFSAVFLNITYALLNKGYQKQSGTKLRHGVVYNIVNGIVATAVNIAVIVFLSHGFEFTLYSALMALLVVIVSGAQFIVSFKALKTAKIAVYQTYTALGGTLIPFLLGVTFLQESVSPIKWVGLILLTLAVIIAGGDSKNSKKSSISQGMFFCLLSFLFAGLTSWFSKLHQVDIGMEKASLESFAIMVSVIRIVIFTGILPFMTDQPSKDEALQEPITRQAVTIAILSAIASSIAYLFMLSNASTFPTSVMFPIYTGGGLVLSAVGGRIFFNERLSSKIIIGISLAVISTFMFF